MSRFRYLYIYILLMVVATGAAAGPYEDYIDRYATLAQEHQERYGIPASITLAQGLLESAAGRSTLAREGNNHFGIKCHKNWEGATMLRNDDAPDECFRCYPTPEESFEDHSLFLKRKRYEPLFLLPLTDYAAWANTLRQCGYATDPNYAARLITIIETYGLYAFDNPLNPEAEATAAFIHETLQKTHAVRKTGGLYYVVARPGDTYGHIAKELKIDKKKLLAYNDMERDGEVKEWEEVYLQPKRDTPIGGTEQATIGDGESLHSLSQRYGMTMETLRRLNADKKDEPGTTIRLK